MIRYMSIACPICLNALSLLATCALFLALAAAGRRIDAKMPMIAMVTSSSIKVKARPAPAPPGHAAPSHAPGP